MIKVKAWGIYKGEKLVRIHAPSDITLANILADDEKAGVVKGVFIPGGIELTEKEKSALNWLVGKDIFPDGDVGDDIHRNYMSAMRKINGALELGLK